MNLAKHMAMLVVMALAWTATVAEARTAVLIDHDNIVVSAKSAADVKHAILVAATGRGWKAVQQTASSIRLQYDKGSKHQVVIDVRYDAKSYGIKYVDSINMNYGEREGTRVIHPNYNRWVDYLIKSISVELLRTP